MNEKLGNRNERIGLIAGYGQFPILFTRAARKMGLKVVAVAHKGETSPDLDREADQVTWIHLGQLGKLIKSLKKAGATRAVMCGGIKKTRMFKDVRPDMKAISLMNKIRHRADDGILRALADVLADEGIEILPSHEMVPELLARRGIITKRAPSTDEQADIDLGWKLMDQWGDFDIGQCLVIKNRVVVAVEAIEGTDACIERGGKLAEGDAVVIKRCKPHQDTRFDLPSVGLATIETMIRAGASCLAVEHGRTLIFDLEAMAAKADQAGISVVVR